MNLIEKLIGNFSRLPGVGKKSASRIVYYLLKTDQAYIQNLSKDLTELKRRISNCTKCGNYTETQPCGICSNHSREHTTLCVVEEPKDVLSIESINQYKGLYHVLMGVISPIDGVGPKDLRISSLLSRIHSEGIREIILATNPTLEGDTTALYIIDLLKKETDVSIARLALGLPVGGDLEYADKLTLARAFAGRNIV